MGPPLKSRFPWIIPDVLQAPRFGRATFAPLPLASLIEHCRVRPNGDMPSGVAPIRFRFKTGREVFFLTALDGNMRHSFVRPQNRTAPGAFELDGAPRESGSPNARFLRHHGDDAGGTQP